MRKVHVLGMKLVLAAVSVGFTLLIGELAIARFMPQNLSLWDNTRDGMTVHLVHANIFHPRSGQYIQTNNLGMRDKERSVEKTPGTPRILVLGDSFMEALQVSYEESFPALLERDLVGKWGPVEVVNLAVSGWGTDDQVTYLERYGLELKPDGVLIMMTLHNDINDNSLLEFHTLESPGLVARPIREMSLARYGTQKLKAYLASTSHLYQLAYQTSMREKVRTGGAQLNQHVASLLRRETSPELESSWALTLALLDEAANVLEKHGAWLAVGMIPLRLQIEDAAYEKFVADHGFSDADMDRDGPQKRVQAWGDDRGIPVIDLLSSFRARTTATGEALYLPVDGHWNAAGHALAAESLSRELIGLVPQANH